MSTSTTTNVCNVFSLGSCSEPNYVDLSEESDNVDDPYSIRIV
ncbi:MAG: hypothetical protein ACW98Y_10380 [Candidatus Thorarchaeota archaeon]